MLIPTLKERFKLLLESAGVYFKRTRSVHFGTDLWLDLKRLGFATLPSRVVFDVGANRGAWTRELLLRYPDTTVHAFEPVPEVFSELQRGLKHCTNVQLNNLGLSDVPRRAQMTTYDVSEFSSLHDSGTAQHQVTGRISVVVSTIDAYCRATGVRRLSLLKTDTEGHDLQVITGARGMLHGSVDLVYTECEFHRGRHPHAKFMDLYSYLTGLGFGFVTLYTESADSQSGFAYGSALFSRRADATRTS